MAQKLTDLVVNVITDQERIHIETPVTVTKEGLFTTTLPDESAKILLDFGMDLKLNRAGRSGFFSSDTLEGLRKQIEKVAMEAISRELIEDKLVIKYQVITKGHYVLDDDKEIIPNGYWVKKKTDDNFCDKWREGNSNCAFHGDMPTISVFARVFHKRTYSYKSGKLLHTLEMYHPKQNGRGNSLDWINSLCNIAPDHFGNKPDYDRFPEVDATEENAAMFVKLFTFIFQANELLKEMQNPEYLLAYIAANQKKELENL